MYFGTASEMLPHLDSDKIRLVAVATEKRLDAAPAFRRSPRATRGSHSHLSTASLSPPERRMTSSPPCVLPLPRLRLRGGLGSSEEARYRAWRFEPEQMFATLKSDRQYFEQAIKAAGLRTQ